jgi:nucleoside phosphorylase
VLETGIGATCAEAAVQWLLKQPSLGNVPYRPRAILCAGFAGALDSTRSVGDIVLATDVVDDDSNCWRTTWPEELPAGEWRPALHRARLHTAQRLIGDSKQKASLGQRHSAMAVDMESAVVARLCSQGDVPFGCIRAISDDSRTSLAPQLVSLLSGARVSPLRLACAILRSPGLAIELSRLARQTRYAAEQLAKALGELLTLTLPWGREL